MREQTSERSRAHTWVSLHSFCLSKHEHQSRGSESGGTSEPVLRPAPLRGEPGAERGQSRPSQSPSAASLQPPTGPFPRPTPPTGHTMQGLSSEEGPSSPTPSGHGAGLQRARAAPLKRSVLWGVTHLTEPRGHKPGAAKTRKLVIQLKVPTTTLQTPKHQLNSHKPKEPSLQLQESGV